jgi:type II secretory pathway component PulF
MPPAARKPGSAAPFAYIAARADGGRSVGIRTATSERNLAEQLRRERLVPVRTLRLPGGFSGSSAGKLSLKDQAELHVQLAQLLTRGVPLVEALDVTRACVGPSARPRVARMRELVASGSSFADACKAVEGFDAVTIAVYRAAERTGDLGGAAKQLAITSRRTLAIKGKAATLLIYPAIVLTISISVTAMMLVAIVPRIGNAIREASGKPLPIYTRVTVAIGEFMRDQWIIVLGSILALAIIAFFARKLLIELGGRAMRTLPLLREVVMAQESARFFTVMAAMARSGVTLGDALAVGVGAINHPKLKKQLVNLRNKLIEGGVLRTLIDTVDALPMPTRRLLMAAERSGDLQNAFDTLAQDTAEELDRRSSRLLAALEPILIVIMFLMIGSLLLSIMIPLMKLSSQVM